MSNNFSSKILAWYDEHKRDLPWRQTKDPYQIWISEIILQQTRVEQGLGYFERFMQRFPTYRELASAPEDDVMKLWQGLGYYSRARNLHKAAKQIQGDFPSTHEDVLALPGVGPYTAAAICSFAYGMAYPVLDGNVYRVLGRYLAIPEAIETSKGKRVFAQAAAELLDQNRPADYNQGIMDFGATHCTQHQPKCDICPLQDSCAAYDQRKVSQFPVKKKRPKVVDRFLYYVSVSDGEYTHIYKRNQPGIWRQLYEFPFFETDHLLSATECLGHERVQDFLNLSDQVTYQVVVQDQKHLLSHQRLHMTCLQITIPPTILSSKDGQKAMCELSEISLQKVSGKALPEYPYHKMMAQFADKVQKLLKP